MHDGEGGKGERTQPKILSVDVCVCVCLRMCLPSCMIKAQTKKGQGQQLKHPKQ